MDFSEFKAFATAHPLSSLNREFVALDEDAVRGRFKDGELIACIPHSNLHDTDGYSELSYFGSLLEVLHPYCLLRILAENPSNLDLNIDWQYGPLVSNGWAKDDEFVPGARRAETFLIATEGSSDAHILRHAISLLSPGVEDFFRFIDVSERHPFPGTGNLLKFAEGLAKIDVQNQVVFLFDNDAEGFETHQRVSLLTLPSNMKSLLLPELEAFRSFSTRGPMGVSAADINRRAASIECYLDLKYSGLPTPRVVWTTYKKDIDTYQGALESKEAFTKAFLRQRREDVNKAEYDFSRIRLVLNALMRECSTIASGIAPPAAPISV
jgi:hypothetical protein